MNGVSAAKARLRVAMHGLRRAAHRPWHGIAAAGILVHEVLAAADLPAGTVAAYWPMAGEADPLPALRRLADMGWQTALPDIVPPAADGAMRHGHVVFRQWTLADGVPPPGAYRIPAPPASAPSVRPDLVLVPLLAADRQGRRLGQGAGFYDRCLADLRQDGGPVLAVGWAMEAQLLRRVPADDRDAPLDWLVTERRALRCPA